MILDDEVADPLSVGLHYVVVGDAPLYGKCRWPRYVVIRRRLDRSDPRSGHILLQRLVDVSVAVEVGLVGSFGRGLVPAIVHTKHDSDDAGFVRHDVAAEAQVNVAAGDAVAAPSRVGEAPPSTTGSASPRKSRSSWCSCAGR
jgi:hypothetical protein